MTAIYEYCGPRPCPRNQGATLVIGGRYDNIDTRDPHMAGLLRAGLLVTVPDAPAAIPATPAAIPATPAAIPATPAAIPATPAAIPAKKERG